MRFLATAVFALASALLRPFIRALKYHVSPPQPRQALGLDALRPLCYVLPERSWIDLLTLRRVCLENGLPAPRDSRGALPSGPQPTCLYLSALRDAMHRRTPLGELAGAAFGDPAFDVQLVPVSIFWGRDPGQETSWLRLLFADTPGAGAVRRFLTMLFNGRNVYVNYGGAMALSVLRVSVGEDRDGLRKLMRVLNLHFLRERRVALGPILPSRATVIDEVLAARAVQEAVDGEASQQRKTQAKAQRRARRIAREVAADYSATTLRIMSLLFTQIWNRVFRGVEVRGLERVREFAREHEILYLPSHRSHADYLLVSYILYHEGLVPPHICAGLNMNLPLVGALLRRCGAFYMRRKFSGDKLYTAVFRSYVDLLMRRGYPISFYPEGGRSRTGRLLPPRTGLLSWVVDSGLRANSRPVAIVPVFIGYDRVFEVNSYYKELLGGGKEPESVAGLLKATKVLSGGYGRAYISFGEPLQLQDYADVHLPGWAEDFARGYGERPAGFPDFVGRLAEEVMRRINAVAAVGPVALAASALLSTPRHAATEDELRDSLGHLVAMLDAWPRREQLLAPVRSPEAILYWAAPIARIQRVPHEWGDILALAPRDATLLTYNRNTVQHVFVLPALIASLFRTRAQLSQEAVLTGCRAFLPFLRSEFFLPWEPADSDRLTQVAIEVLVTRGLLVRPDESHLRRPDVSMPAYAALAGLGRMLGETLERQAMVLLLLARRGAQRTTVERDEFVKDVRALASRLGMLTGRDAPEFHDPLLFKRYVETLTEVGLLRVVDATHVSVDPRMAKTAERVVELLSDETRQTLLQLLARRREREVSPV